jgi:hypothetical protein
MVQFRHIVEFFQFNILNNIHLTHPSQFYGIVYTYTPTLLTYLPTYSMEQSPSWEAHQFSQLPKKFPASYGTRSFFTVLASARHLSLSWANSIQSPRLRSWLWLT